MNAPRFFSNVRFKKKNIQLIFFSAVCTLFFHKNADVFGKSKKIIQNQETRKPLYWNPVINNGVENFVILPDIIPEVKKPRILLKNELNLEETKRKLHRYLSNANFMEISKNEIPPYSKIRCREDLGRRIPNIVHYVWFGKLELKLHQYLSLRSAASIQQPQKLYLHMDLENSPTGQYWERLKSEVPCLEIQRHKPSEFIYGHRLAHVEHQSDILRMQVLYDVGGIYLDINAYFVNPMDNLMNNSFVIGKEKKGCYGNSVMLSEPGSPFLKLWFENYHNFKPWEWNEHSTHLPVRLHEENPQVEIYVDEYSMMRPNYKDGMEWMLTRNWDLSDNYCVHLYENSFELEYAPILAMSEDEMIKIDSTFGQIVRRSLFGQYHIKEDEIPKSIEKIECAQPTTSQNRRIPNILHFIWDVQKFNYHNYLSIRSAAQVFKPSSIIFHILGTEEQIEQPFHYLWVRLNHEIPCITIHRFKGDFGKFNSNSDQEYIFKMKLNAVVMYGGIVWDVDAVALRPIFKDITDYGAVVSLEERNALSNVVIAGEKSSPFLQRWIDLIEEKNQETIQELKIMAQTMPDLKVKIIPSPLMMAPKSWFLEDIDDFRQQRASGFYFKYWLNQNEEDILKENTTYSKIARYISYGNYNSVL
uniref:uncharacterized protein LOC120330833 n=1 Tax=Styela clava TaxID=7725 RepID=UPI00193A3E7D|nr:uncharacterized protein LOC120330833 [Styela clava]